MVSLGIEEEHADVQQTRCVCGSGYEKKVVTGSWTGRSPHYCAVHTLHALTQGGGGRSPGPVSVFSCECKTNYCSDSGADTTHIPLTVTGFNKGCFWGRALFWTQERFGGLHTGKQEVP